MSRKVQFYGRVIGSNGREFSDRVRAHDRREAGRILSDRHSAFGGKVLFVDVDAGAFIGQRDGSRS